MANIPFLPGLWPLELARNCLNIPFTLFLYFILFNFLRVFFLYFIIIFCLYPQFLNFNCSLRLMSSPCDVSTLSREEVLAKLREVADLRAKCELKQETLLARFNSLPDGSPAKARAYKSFHLLRLLEDSLYDQRQALTLRLDFLLAAADSENDIAFPPVNDRPSHDEPVINDLPPSPLTIWASHHEADPNSILDLCTPSLQRTNRPGRIRRTPKFLCKRISSMISPASFKRAQKNKKNLSLTRLVLSSYTIRSLVRVIRKVVESGGDDEWSTVM
ncbi:hypothetical protein RhiirA4_431175 [Rhizophagus irregularis]|uniref:Uncharacterized protein n=1 Tax=Rhizophagus irregularis TaxID=588596 RepID=A0A2I1HNR2_9GLOM|nr:hypothetical protein RhiirA4_431175 [Rhizophagus irregularis]